MTWRGSADGKDRFFATLPYILPLISVYYPFGGFLLEQFPILNLIYLPLQPLLKVYYGFPLAGMVIFFLLFLAVVRNYRISHFIRFNTMQAILIDILLVLLGLVMQFLVKIPSGLLIETLFNVIFLGTVGLCFYGVIQSALGKYAEIPTISEAAYSQVG